MKLSQLQQCSEVGCSLVLNSYNWSAAFAAHLLRARDGPNINMDTHLHTAAFGNAESGTRYEAYKA